VIENIGNGEMALVGRHLGIKQNLQKQIAQLLGQVGKVAPLDGVEDLVGLLKRVFADGIEGLFAVPGASAGGAQPRHDGRRLLEQGRCPRGIGRDVGSRGWCGMAFERSVHASPV